MKIDFTPKDFLRLFKIAASVASTKYITPILQNVKIVADKQDGAILMATNLEIGIRVRLDVNVSESGEALLPVKTLRTILDSTKEPTLTMERTQDGKVVVYGANERHELCTQDPDEFPNVEGFRRIGLFRVGRRSCANTNPAYHFCR
jgi:DNA polymerase-3 subunit beta